MPIANQLLSVVLSTAKAAGLDQRALAKASGRTPETISRAKTRSTIDLDTLEALASAAGLQLVLRPLGPPAAAVARTSSLADPKWGLAWSNRDASAQALVGNALMRGAFTAILEAALEYGMPFVREQWSLLCASGQVAPKSPVRGYIADMLDNIEKGFAHAQA